MGLPAALQAHGKHDLVNAELHYRRALEQKDYKPVLFQNFGALLREIGKIDEALQVYEQGIKLYPDNTSVKKNFSNLLREVSPSKAIMLPFGAAEARAVLLIRNVQKVHLYP